MTEMKGVDDDDDDDEDDDDNGGDDGARLACLCFCLCLPLATQPVRANRRMLLLLVFAGRLGPATGFRRVNFFVARRVRSRNRHPGHPQPGAGRKGRPHHADRRSPKVFMLSAARQTPH